jgi:hypothetical protein
MVPPYAMSLSIEMLSKWKNKNRGISMARLPFEYTIADGTTLCNIAFH